MRKMLFVLALLPASLWAQYSLDSVRTTDTPNAGRVRINANAATLKKVTSPAGTFYVSPTFTSVGKPYFTTIKQAVDSATAGTVILVRPGEYSESAITIGVKNLAIIGDAPAVYDSATQTASSASVRILFAGSNRIYANGKDGIVLKNLAVERTDPGECINIYNSSNVTIENCIAIGTAYDSPYHGFLVENGGYIQIKGSRCYRQTHGFAVLSSNTQVSDCYAEDCYTDGLIVKSKYGTLVRDVVARGFISKSTTVSHNNGIVIETANAGSSLQSVSVGGFAVNGANIAGVYIKSGAGTAGISDVAISDGSIDTPWQGGVRIDSADIFNVHISGVTSRTSAVAGFVVRGGDGITLTGCTSVLAASWAFQNVGGTNVRLLGCHYTGTAGGTDGTFVMNDVSRPGWSWFEIDSYMLQHSSQGIQTDYGFGSLNTTSYRINMFGQNHGVYTFQNPPAIGFNAEYDSTWRFGVGPTSAYGGLMSYDHSSGMLTFSSSLVTGTTNTPATFVPYATFDKTGNMTLLTGEQRFGGAAVYVKRNAGGELVFADTSGVEYTLSQLAGAAPVGDSSAFVYKVTGGAYTGDTLEISPAGYISIIRSGHVVTFAPDTGAGKIFTQTMGALKANAANPAFTGTVTLPTGLTGTLRAASGVVSATPSDSIGLAALAASKIAKSDTNTYAATRAWVEAQGYGSGSLDSLDVVAIINANTTAIQTSSGFLARDSAGVIVNNGPELLAQITLDSSRVWTSDSTVMGYFPRAVTVTSIVLFANSAVSLTPRFTYNDTLGGAMTSIITSPASFTTARTFVTLSTLNNTAVGAGSGIFISFDAITTRPRTLTVYVYGHRTF